MEPNTRMLVINYNTKEQRSEKIRAELEKIRCSVESMGFERLDSYAEDQIAQRLATARHYNNKYYIIITGNDIAVLSKLVRLHTDNFLKVTDGNFVELKNFQRHPETVWGLIN